MSETTSPGGRCPVTGAAGDPATDDAAPAKAGRRGRKARAGGAKSAAGGRRGGPQPPKVAFLQDRVGLFTLWRKSRRNILEVIPVHAIRRRIYSGRLLRRFHVVTDPEGTRQIFKANIGNYPKSPEAKGILAKALRHGIFVLEGDEWRWQRRALNPAFAPRNIRRLGPLMTRAAEEGAERLAGQTGPVNVSKEMMHTAFDVIARVTFAGGDGQSAVPLDVINHAIEHYLSETARISLLDYLGLPGWVPRPGRVRTHPTLRALKDGADAAIADRRRTPNTENPALLDLLLDVQDPETGRRMTDEELRDNLITFLIAGHETTALTLSWALLLLAIRPETQARASAEAVRVLGSRTATVDDVAELDYIRQVLNEAMRLYPPIPVHMRTALAPDTVCEHAVKAGDTMILPFHALHRHRELWQKPDQFIPERFADMSKIDRYAYLPFSVGPRVCIGAEFAMQESVIILATLLARYRFSLGAAPLPKPKLILTLRPDRDIWLDIAPLAPAGAA